MNRWVAILFGFTLILICTTVQAQQIEPSELEIGAQFSSLTLTPPAQKREVGVGGRLTFNFNRNLALEAEVNYFPSGSTKGFTHGGNILQGQFGVKAGKRWDRFGIFAKARPGFLSFDGSFAARPPGTTTINGSQFPFLSFDIIRRTHFSMDLGGVVEVYPSRRVIVRFDAGDTITRYGPHDEFDFSKTPVFVRAPARTAHNFQFSAGVSFRLLTKDEGATVTSQTATAGNESPPRFEVGAHLTSLTFNPPRFLFAFPTISGENHPLTETGLGGRFTFNLIDSLGFESEINYFPASEGVGAGASGRVLQGQFGIKAGKRFKRFGFFGKVRPGFVSFDRSLKLVGTEPFTFGTIQAVRGIFEFGRRTFFSNDVGGVLEFYPSRRWAVRFDAGDTVIHYGPRSIETFFVTLPFITAPPEWQHNFQFSSGFSFKF